MTFWTAANMRATLSGGWLIRPGGPRDEEYAGLSTDTRTLKPGQVFLALRGERFDGHDHLADAVDAGARLLIVDDPEAVAAVAGGARSGPGVLRVADARRALMRLAASYRKRLEGTRVIAVTGSNGKTTTVRLIDSILRTRLRGAASLKSYNNDVGVPLTILSARPGDQYLVCEVGSNSPGEIAPLASVISPDIAVITSIGRAHIEHLGSRQGIAREKASLLACLAPNGVAIVTADAPELSEFLKPVPHVLTFGRSPSADLRVTAAEHTVSDSGTASLRFTLNDRQTFESPLIGAHNAMNAAAAIAVARRMGFDDASIAPGVAGVSAADMRLTRRTIAGIDLFVDCYNASPESTLAAVETFASLSASARRRVLVLGDMLELGRHAPEAHEEVAEAVQGAIRTDLLVTVGRLSLLIADRLSPALPSGRAVMLSGLDDEQAERLARRLQPGDAVLIKGSRLMGLERLVYALERISQAPADATTAA